MRYTSFIICFFNICYSNCQNLEIIHINIGQGSSTLILGPEENGRRISVLFDCGQTLSRTSDKDGGLIIYNLLNEKGIKILDYLVISHYDADHLGGLIYGENLSHRTSFSLGPNNVPGELGDDDNDGQGDWLDKNYNQFDFSEWGLSDDIKITNIVDRGDESTPSSAAFGKYLTFTQAVSERVSIITLSDIEDFQINLGNEVRISCLAGNGIVIGEGQIYNASSENERSIALLVQYNKFDYLIGGDLIGKRGTESGPEDARLEYYVGKYIENQDINIDVLVANHHGANNTSELGFLNLIKAENAIISVGENTYGHPHPDHLERLIGSGVARIYQTNLGSPKWPVSQLVKNKQFISNNHITITTDGENYSINNDHYVCDN